MAEQSLIPADESWLTPLASWITPRGLKELPDDLSYEDWAKLGLYIGTVFTASKFALGDWLNFGEHRYGEKYVQAAAATGRSEQGLMNIASTSRAWPLETRKGEYGLHEELKAKARDDIEGAKELLTRAVDEGWTRDQLRAEIRPAVETKPTVLRLTLDEFAERFEQWKAAGLYGEYRTRGAAMMSAFLEYLR